MPDELYTTLSVTDAVQRAVNAKSKLESEKNGSEYRIFNPSVSNSDVAWVEPARHPDTGEKGSKITIRSGGTSSSGRGQVRSEFDEFY